MPARRKPEDPAPRRHPPARTPDARENELILLATDLAEQQMRQGTASSQVVTHYLKLGSSRERLEQEKIELEKQLLEKKREVMASAERVEQLYEGAINAMRSYAGQPPLEFDEEEEEML